MTTPSLPTIRFRELTIVEVHRSYDGVLEAEVTTADGDTRWLTAALDPDDPDCDHYPSRWELWTLTDEQWTQVRTASTTEWFEGGTPVAVVRL